MNSPEGESDFCQMPLSLRPSLIESSNHALEDVTPSDVASKVTTGFNRSSSLLDRQMPHVTPVPAPRRSSSNRMYSANGMGLSLDESSHTTVPMLQGTSQTRFSRSLDLMDTDDFSDEVFSRLHGDSELCPSVSYSLEDLPVYAQQSSELVKDTSSLDTNVPSTNAEPHDLTSVTVTMVRPVPKPRTRTRIATSQNRESSPGLPLKSDLTLEESLTISSAAEERQLDKFSSVHDSSTSQIMEDKVGLSNGSFPAKNVDGYVEPDDLVSDKRVESPTSNPETSDEEIYDYVSPDAIINGFPVFSGFSSEPTSAVPQSPRPHTVSLVPSYIPMSDERRTYTSGESDVRHSSSTQKYSTLHSVELKFDLESATIDDSSTDDVLISEKTDKNFNVNSPQNPTTQSPFGDIQPFRPKISSNVDAWGKEKTLEIKHQNMNHHGIDLLWGETSDPVKTPSKSELPENQSKASLSELNSSFVVDWDSAFAHSNTMESDVHSSKTDDRTKGINGLSEHSYLCKDVAGRITSATGLTKPQENRLSFVNETPIAATAPVLKHQNHYAKHVPPSRPRRPDDASNSSIPLIPSKILHPKTTANSSLPPTRSQIFHGIPVSETSFAPTPSQMLHSKPSSETFPSTPSKMLHSKPSSETFPSTPSQMLHNKATSKKSFRPTSSQFQHSKPTSETSFPLTPSQMVRNKKLSETSFPLTPSQMVRNKQLSETSFPPTPSQMLHNKQLSETSFPPTPSQMLHNKQLSETSFPPTPSQMLHNKQLSETSFPPTPSQMLHSKQLSETSFPKIPSQTTSFNQLSAHKDIVGSPSASVSSEGQTSHLLKDSTDSPFPPTPSQTQHGQKTAIQTTSPSKDVFVDMPAGGFLQGQIGDPFRDSAFGIECHQFNKAQAPNTPVGAGGSSHDHPKAFIDTSHQPEHNHLVSHRKNSQDSSHHSVNHDLTRELSSSDSESPELTLSGTSDRPWSSSSGTQGTRLKVFDSSLLPKKNARFGYLYKQGGYKANKGWKKRWVVYNGTNLSYYSNDTTQVSKRIIPVRCMVSVETDIKATDKDSFRFKVVTSLKDRVFVFSSETLDDCLTWANTLMAAVTEYKKSIKAEEPPPVKPDIEGFIKFGNMKRYYVTITGKTFGYYQSYEDYQMGSPTHEIDMKLASVKVKDHKKLQLWIYYGHFNLAFESDQEMQQWRLAMEDAIAEGLADDTVLKKVYENMSNQHCADCGVGNPHWASINLGIVVCKNCAGVHRMFDYRVSKIRSLRMDTRVWTPSLIELMVAVGNANANAFWEFELPAGAKLQPMESMEKRKEFIFKKYKSKKFCRSDLLANQGANLGEELLAAASHDNVLELMKVLFAGADVLYRREEHGPSAYDVAKTNGQRLIMELLYQNGGDPQTLEQDVTDENRLREDVRLQGFLNKAGPVGKMHLEKRWCVLEHGSLTYYQNEKSKTFKGSINRKDMYMIQAVESERISCSFELSTGLKDNRIFTFISESRDDCGEWIRTIAKLMAPVPVMEQVGMIDVKLAGYAFMKECLVDDWHQTFIVFSWRGIYFMNRDLRFDHLDLRKASGIKMQDSSNGYQQQGPCFVISSTGKSVYLQATLTRDTERMYNAFLDAIVSSGPTLIDQALTNENVPVIVEKCITHIYMNGLEEKGIYRVAGQNSRVQSLLDEFRKDVWAVSLSSYTVQDVSNALKRFLRELDDSVFGRLNYSSWINMAAGKDVNHRLMWYKYYLEKLPLVNFHTLKRIILHLLQVSQHENRNLMSIANLASCFAPSLMRTVSDEQPIMVSDAASKEISIMVDLLTHSDYFFNVNENEKIILNNIKQAEKEIQKRIQENRKSVIDPATAGILIPVHMLSREGQSLNVLVTEEKTAKEAMDYLRRNKAAIDLGIYVLHEQLFKGALERPLFPEDIIAKTTNRWMEWESWVMEDNSVCLCVQGLGLLERLNTHFSPDHSLLSKHQYCDSKPKSKFKRRMIGFRQCKLAVYNDSQGNSELVSWKVEDITLYLGSMPRRTLPPHRHCLTFIVNGEKYAKPPFGHCLSFETEEELYRWAAALYAAQHPAGLLSWANQ